MLSFFIGLPAGALAIAVGALAATYVERRRLAARVARESGTAASAKA